LLSGVLESYHDTSKKVRDQILMKESRS
jgi:hypothetical protein